MSATENTHETNVPIRSNVTVSPFRSAESFETYCNKVQSKLSEHAQKRIDFVQTAFDRLTRLLQAAKDVEDTSLYNEIWHHRVTAKELLDSLKQNSTPGAPPIVPPVPSLQVQSPMVEANAFAPAYLPKDIAETPLVAKVSPPIVPNSPPSYAQTQQINPPQSYPPTSQNGYDQGYGNGNYSGNTDTTPRIPRRLRPLTDIEGDAIRLREEVRKFAESRPLTTRLGDLSVPNCLMIRAYTCRQRRLEDEAGDTEVAEVTELMEDIVDLLDSADDQEYTIALDDEIDPQPTAYQWGELAERYEEMAQAQEAFEWWNRHRAVLTVGDVQPLAEAVAAVQQRFNRLLFRIGARDPFQQRLFDELRTWAKEQQCYLHSLRPKVPMNELAERAASLVPTWEVARLVVDGENFRQTVVENIITLTSQPDFGAQEHDGHRLREAVWDCKQQKIPASDRRLREALLPWAVFLEGDDRFKDILREINIEWEKRQDMGKPEPAAETANLDVTNPSLWLELKAVKEATKGKRCLILGGTSREANRRKMEDALELSELVWPCSKPGDALSKFDSEIRHSDIVAVFTRFSRKEWMTVQETCERDGKLFVNLPSGYGLSQILKQFSLRLAPEKTEMETASTQS